MQGLYKITLVEIVGSNVDTDTLWGLSYVHFMTFDFEVGLISSKDCSTNILLEFYVFELYVLRQVDMSLSTF